LVEVLDWAAEALNRVDRAAFFTRFSEEHAVQYFYEPFLEAFDPQLRRQLGVWYTPPEVVQYMVAKVDHVLRTELEIPDGLADERVVVLDPCCGTGAYLVEVLNRIGRTLRERGDDALVASDVKRAARKRVFGFEIMPAPFVVAHLQLGLVMQQMDAPFGDEERAGVYLTNALTGWVPAEEPKDQIPIALPELATEREQAEHVKQDAPILVILGNPPYSGYAGMAIGEERDLSDAYRTTKKAPKPQGQGLNDLYVRFFRMAERKIVEMKPHKGVICFISNYSWLDGLSFTGMRERYIEKFDRIDVDSLNGDKYRTGKVTPEGEPDPSIFSTEYNREGIQVGTAIVTLVRKEEHEETDTVRYRDLWGKGKLAELERDAEGVGAVGYAKITPAAGIGYPLMPRATAEGYLEWPKLTDLFPVAFPGVKTSRDEFLVDIDREQLEHRISSYLDPELTNDEIARDYPSALVISGPFHGPRIRRRLLARTESESKFIRFSYRPFDVRWLYWDADSRLLDRPRIEYVRNVNQTNLQIISQQRPRREWSTAQVISTVGCIDLMDRSASCIPLVCQLPEKAGDLFSEPRHHDFVQRGEARNYNLSAPARVYLTKIGSVQADAPHFFHDAIGIMHAPAYREENAGALRQDWPRIPLPSTREQLVRSADLGRQLAALLNPETPVPGVTTGDIRPELRVIGSIRKADGGQLNPDAGDLAVTAGWGYAGARGVTMPGRGKSKERPYTDDERAAIESGAERLGLSADDSLALLGDTTYDIYLNEGAYWSCVPSRVWEYTLGGYQVIKKWLSYREQPLLGRALKPDEVREVTNIARRIAATLLMEKELDGNYKSVKAEACGRDREGLGRL
ncbi:MAG TPA: type ISP restriction/modification enzyme, partial [Longimicrobiaceae bacterium]|nr:type ISP restriction/modification enzyme [Longimicrobiaceae bacterium]